MADREKQGLEQKKDERDRGESREDRFRVSTKSKGRASFSVALWKAFGMDFVLQQTRELANTAIRLSEPLVLGLLLDYLEDGSGPMWKGYLICLLMVTSHVTQTLLNVRTNFINKAFDLRVRSAIVNSVFRKALTMDAECRQQTTVGQAVNLMSVDAEDICHTLCTTASDMWTAPLRVIVVMGLLYNLLGPSMLAGVLVLLAMVPINSVVTGRLDTKQTELMDLKDTRLKIFTEVVNGIKILKMNAWEPSFLRMVDSARRKELDVMWWMALWETAIHFYWKVAPHLVAVAVFVSYVYTSEEGCLSPSTVFVVLSLLGNLREAMGALPEVFSDLVKVTVSFRRLEEFLNRTDLQDKLDTDVDIDEAISIRNGSYSWSSNAAPIFNNLSVSVKEGSLVAVVGPVGCGKSSLLSACLGHMHTLTGHASRKGTTAYVPQQAWLQHATVRDNVLFGRPLNQHRYQQCLHACALSADLNILPAGDLTEIGEKGVSLSGGQRQRVSLARAAYSQADLYLLDDPLSAVDSHVGAHIFTHLLGPQGLLAGKTRVLVTHGLQWLPLVDEVIVMGQGGRVREVGSYRQLLHLNGHFATFLRQYFTAHDAAQPALEDDRTGNNSSSNNSSRGVYNDNNIVSNNSSSSREKEGLAGTEIGALEPTDHESRYVNSALDRAPGLKDDGGPDETSREEDEKMRNGDEKGAPQPTALVEDDDEKVYHPSWSTLREYGRVVGGRWVTLLLMLFAVQQTARRAADVALSHWTDDPDLNNVTALPANSSERLALNRYYLSVYAALGFLHALVSLSFKVTQLMRQIHVAGMLHHRMLSRVLRAPIAFFDTTPVGRILHRFGNNLHVMDTELTETMETLVVVVMGLVGKVAVLSYLTPPFLLLLPPLAAVIYFTQYWYVAAMRQMARLEYTSVASSYSFFSETLGGVATIRAFGAQARFIREFERRVDLAFSCTFSWDALLRWMEVRLRGAGGVMVGLVVLYVLHNREGMSAGTAGLALTLALQIGYTLRTVVIILSWVQCELTSVDRVTEYCNMPVEADWTKADTAPCPSWPQRGEVKVTDLDLRYRDGLDLVLKGVNIHVKAGEKVGIVGRTGAGKSSLTLALFRLIEPARGKVTIDDLCTSDLGLHDLRSRLTILPQDPVIFAGSLRMNLDPFARYTDTEVWSALRHAHLRDFVSGLDDGLMHECGEGGENLSMGQRQLLCLARALLLKTRVLVLDEATAAVDVETDDLIQQTLRHHFAHCTVLTIAHRLRTVLDYDKILVLERGEVVEFDSPSTLMHSPSSRFRHMASKAGLLPPNTPSPLQHRPPPLTDSPSTLMHTPSSLSSTLLPPH
ncbi:hypothetical protein ACOMHN_060660 [Nucella lapillus]